MASSSTSTSVLPRLPIFEAVARHDPESIAVVHSLSGRSFTYGQLLGDVRRARDRLREASGRDDLDVTLLAVLAARSIAVPLSPAFPAPELEYILNHSEASLLVSSTKFVSKAQEVLAIDLKSKPAYLELAKHLSDASQKEHVALEGDSPGGAGLMLYTSGTTNRPRSHCPGQFPTSGLEIHPLRSPPPRPPPPPHPRRRQRHPHPLFAGSSIEFMFPFNPDAVWRRLAAPFLPTNGDNPKSTKVTFFTVVPTVYSRLLATHKSLSPEMQEATREAISPSNLRINISGSAALPTPIKAAWSDLSRGNVLLERYGMTEVGMALSCGLDFADRVDASVGWPLPSVQARLVDVDTGEIIQPGQELDPKGRERSGEIQLRGPTIFQEYWRNPEATEKEFVAGEDGQGRWFKTGDVAVRRAVPSAGQNAPAQPWAQGLLYFIQGRKTADIIKTGGEKVSALEVERELLSLPEVSEAAVVAVPSGNWGQKVGAVIVLDTEYTQKWTPLEMRRALKSRLANYKIPQVMRVVDHIPRNAMGKINKKQLVRAIFVDEFSGDEV
ncbi:Acyl-CoA synthetase family member 3 [Cladobotryum mycophilum]|uniref:Acyl-CoA synthetase family member 3 n=1 Tax=Cladobotryum mycophilum TaxID=491253 RepID=A0ABR0SK57_9HYPO